MVSKANLKLIEGDLEIQEKKPDEFGLYGEAACIGALAPANPGQDTHLNPLRIIAHDEKHSSREERWFCMGKVEGRILTVQFRYRHSTIRIFGAGCWRKWSKYYEQENHIAG